MSGKTSKITAPFDTREVFIRLIRYLLRHKTIALMATFFMIITALTEASLALMVKEITDQGFVQASEWTLKWMPLVMLGMMLLRAVVGYLSNFFMARLGRNVVYDVRADTFNNLITLPSSYFDQNSSSKNVSKLIYDVESTAQATTDTLTVLSKDSVLTIALISTLVYLDWRLTLIFVVTIPVLFYITRYTNSRFRRTTKGIQDSIGSIADTVKEASLGQKVIKIYGGHKQEIDNFEQVNQFNYRQNIKRARVSSAIVPFTLITLAPAIAIILYVYLNFLRTGPESAGDFVGYFVACLQLTSPLKRLAKVNEKIQIGITAANSVFQVMDTPAETDDGIMPLLSTRGHLKFENVSFNYGRDDGLAVLKNISFEIRPGQRIAIVGPSGSGKSTLTALILRLYSPETGLITLDGHNIDDIILKDLRRHFSLVSQETNLFDDTIANNIMYGMLNDVDEDRLKASIEAAHVDEFLYKLPMGLETIVGEQGMRLSGGQRQRIAIARAIYKNAPILILDEATSALDNTSERFVQDGLETLMKGRTSLVIAHRLSTIENADSIVVLEKGQIVEQGSHRKLLKKGGTYANLHQGQGKKSKRGFFFFK